MNLFCFKDQQILSGGPVLDVTKIVEKIVVETTSSFNFFMDSRIQHGIYIVITLLNQFFPCLARV